MDDCNRFGGCECFPCDHCDSPVYHPNIRKCSKCGGGYCSKCIELPCEEHDD